MRRILSLLLAAVLTGTLAACSGGADTTDMSLADIGNTIAESQPDSFTDGLLPLTAGEEAFAAYLSASFGLEEGTWTDGVLAHSTGASSDELAVLLMANAQSADQAEAALADYITRRTGDFFGYAPEEAAQLEEALVLRRGLYVALLVCPDPQGAREAFEDCFDRGSSVQTVFRPAEVTSALDEHGYVAFRPPNVYDMTIWDNSAVVNAYRSGDDSALSDEELAVLDRCRSALDECIREDMSAYEKERAVYGWIISNTGYDWDHSQRAFTPPGLLLDGEATCLGYATTFQLFMDLLEIPCLTVVGAAFQSTEDHAWNMVCLDGTWYCVDATWDNTAVGPEAKYHYFNVTSQYMRDTDHQWDYDAVPEATDEAASS